MTVTTAGAGGGAVIVVSYILPLVISREGPTDATPEWRVEWNQDSVISRKSHMPSAKRVIWVGCPGLSVAAEEQANKSPPILAPICLSPHVSPCITSPPPPPIL